MLVDIVYQVLLDGIVFNVFEQIFNSLREGGILS